MENINNKNKNFLNKLKKQETITEFSVDVKDDIVIKILNTIIKSFLKKIYKKDYFLENITILIKNVNNINEIDNINIRVCEY